MGQAIYDVYKDGASFSIWQKTHSMLNRGGGSLFVSFLKPGSWPTLSRAKDYRASREVAQKFLSVGGGLLMLCNRSFSWHPGGP